MLCCHTDTVPMPMVVCTSISSPPHNLTFHRPFASFFTPPSSSSSSYASSSTSHALRNPSLRVTTSTTKIQSLARREEASASPPSEPGYDAKAGVAVYKPKSYDVLVTDAANSLAFALQDGKLRLEIDFPYVMNTFIHSYLAFFSAKTVTPFSKSFNFQ